MDGCLLIHGLTGTPATVASLRDRLVNSGFQVSVPCLAGHGTTVEDLAKCNWQEWYETVRISYDALRKEADRIFCAGISLGALLSLKLAIDEGWGVRAMALLSTPLELSFFERLLIRSVRYSPLRWIVKAVPKDMKRNVADPEGREDYAQISLPMLPVKAVYEIVDLQRVLRSQLKDVANPILMLHGKGDIIAPTGNIDLVKKSVKSDIVESVVFPKSRHVITMDYDKNDISRIAVDFFTRFQ